MNFACEGYKTYTLRAHVSAAPLKCVDCARVHFRLSALRAHVSAAPLKSFPRTKRSARHTPLRAHVSAAPLKLCQSLPCRFAARPPPRSRERGPVEVALVMLAFHAAVYPSALT